jgi:putative ABC transport system substrate-binding protein
MRWGEGRAERYTEIATEFVRLKAAVIVTSGTAVRAVQEVTSKVPIVFAVAVDPVGDGVVKSLATPGGNATGLSVQSPDLAGKRLEILRELVAGVRRIGIMFNEAYPAAGREMGEVQEAARAAGLESLVIPVRRAQDIAPAFAAIEGRTDALFVCTDALMSSSRVRIGTLAAAARLPTMHGNREYVETGGLVSYGANYADLFRRASEYVDRILKGARPGELPVEQPTKFDLVLNLTTAAALRIPIPPTLLARADEVIE